MKKKKESEKKKKNKKKKMKNTNLKFKIKIIMQKINMKKKNFNKIFQTLLQLNSNQKTQMMDHIL